MVKVRIVYFETLEIFEAEHTWHLNSTDHSPNEIYQVFILSIEPNGEDLRQQSCITIETDMAY